MKKIIYILAAFAAVSCSEGVGDSSYAPVAPFTLSVDRSEIESDGKQVATFVITDAEGKILIFSQKFISRTKQLESAFLAGLTPSNRLKMENISFRLQCQVSLVQIR